ncbi:putative uncharacterized phage protein [Aliivibrio wodanis]|uniref:Uncharacterized phage protein n=1 Tax=Aliivibrio wodanis TaxID=80852 RepID=A0A090IQE0_9GAMM|nr:putative uncharacterized phage protein [Aliivibrio wodanis]
MSNELNGFFTLIMSDLDDRERMWERYLKQRPHEQVCCQHHLATIGNIKRLTLSRARQFGLVVNDDPKILKQDEEFGVVDIDARRKQVKHIFLSQHLICLGEY